MMRRRGNAPPQERKNNMYNVNDAKEKLCNHLMAMDISRLNMVDLISSASVVRTLDEISKPNCQEQFSSMMHALSTHACEMREVEPHD